MNLRFLYSFSYKLPALASRIRISNIQLINSQILNISRRTVSSQTNEILTPEGSYVFKKEDISLVSLTKIKPQIEAIFNEPNLNTVTELLDLSDEKLLQIMTFRASKGRITLNQLKKTLCVFNNKRNIEILVDYFKESYEKYPLKNLEYFVKGPQAEKVKSSIHIDYSSESLFWSLIKDGNKVEMLGTIPISSFTKNFESFAFSCSALLSTLPNADIYFVKHSTIPLLNTTDDKRKFLLLQSSMLRMCFYTNLLLDKGNIRKASHDKSNKSKKYVFLFPMTLTQKFTGLPDFDGQRRLVNDIKLSYIFNPNNNLDHISTIKIIETSQFSTAEDKYHFEHNILTRDFVDYFIIRKAISPYIFEVIKKNSLMHNFFRFASKIKFSEKAILEYDVTSQKNILADSIWANIAFNYAVNVNKSETLIK